MERGWKEFMDHLSKRQNNKYPVYWDVKRNVLPFGTPFKEILDGFRQTNQGDLVESVRSLAKHEQINILQPLMYNDPDMQGALKKNQLAWAMRFPSGVYNEVQLTLSAQCRGNDAWTSYFPSLRTAKLWVVEERMAFVYRAATRFNELLCGRERPYVEESLRVIAAGGGVV
jgi:hypothetical protein